MVSVENVPRVRPATRADVPAIEELIARSARALSDGYYTATQVESLLREDPLLDPSTEPARIRAFFVHPAAARQGLGRRLFDECRGAAAAAGFRALTLVATLPGEPLYQALGFQVTERFQLRLPDQVEVPVARMSRNVT